MSLMSELFKRQDLESISKINYPREAYLQTGGRFKAGVGTMWGMWAFCKKKDTLQLIVNYV